MTSLMTSLILISFVSFSAADVKQEVVYVHYKPAAPLDLNCTLLDPPEEGKVTWMYGEKEMDLDLKESKLKYTAFPNNTLRILKVEPDVISTDKYTCVDDSDKTRKQEFIIYVYPFVVPAEKPRNIIQGDPMSLECRAWSIPAPNISWEHDGQPIPVETRVFYKNSSSSSSGPKFPILENGILRIEGMDDKDAGNYTCYARTTINDIAVEASATTLVQVKNKYAALWPFLGICAEVAILCAIILIYEKRRAKRIEEEERQEEATHLNANNDTKAPIADDVRQRK